MSGRHTAYGRPALPPVAEASWGIFASEDALLLLLLKLYISYTPVFFCSVVETEGLISC